MKTLPIIFALAIVAALLCAYAPAPLTSPVESPLPGEIPPELCTPSPDSDGTSADVPQGLENCPGGCIEVLACVGRPTCNAWCAEQAGADVAPEYLSPPVVNGVCMWPGVERPPEPDVRPGWIRVVR